MKKRAVSILLCAVMICSMLAGCGDSKKETDEKTTTEEETTADAVRDVPSMEDIDVEKCVTLGTYKGIDVKKTITQITDEDVETQIAQDLANNPMELTDESAKVEEGDTVNIDYVGKIDGEAFEGGTAEEALLTIGSGQFIEGFESGLVGTVKGQTVDLNLTFPEDYGSEELSGQDVVFTVTINAIRRPITAITDEWVAANSDSSTVDEYRTNLKKEMQDEQNSIAEENLITNAWMQVVQSAAINEYPETLMDYGKETLQMQVENYAGYQGQTVEEYLENSGMTAEDFEQDKQDYAEAVASQMLVMQAIIDSEGYSVKDEEYQSALESFMTQYGLDEQGLYDTYGKNNVYQTIMMQRISEMILAEANIEEVLE